MTANFSQTAAYIWSLADLLRGDFKQSQYGRVILPFTILRRLECVLESSKPKVLEQVEKLKAMKKLEEDAREKFLVKAAGQSFYNTSPMDLSKLGSSDIKSNLLTYVDSFSTDAREIFEHFKFSEFIGQLEEANLLFKVVQKVATTDLSPKAISNHGECQASCRQKKMHRCHPVSWSERRQYHFRNTRFPVPGLAAPSFRVSGTRHLVCLITLP